MSNKTRECQAGKPEFCPHHGYEARLKTAILAGDTEAYIAVKEKLHAISSPHSVLSGSEVATKTGALTVVGTEAYNEIMSSIHDTPDKKSGFSLKTLSSKELFLETCSTLKEAGIPTVKVRSAALLAAYLHRNETRLDRMGNAITPYIEHPLRNTLRLIRFGCRDETVLVGSLLHDTVEDNPRGFAYFTRKHSEDEQEARSNAYQYIEEQYGKDTRTMVEGMSNPILPSEATRAEKHAAYREHVLEAIQNPHVFLGKISDYFDNAYSLHHSAKSMSNESMLQRTNKYLMVAEVLKGRMLLGFNGNCFGLSERKLQTMFKQFDRGQDRLKQLNQDAKRSLGKS